jgi:hypothetical protein
MRKKFQRYSFAFYNEEVTERKYLSKYHLYDNDSVEERFINICFEGAIQFIRI